jgi:RNA polymerase sigma-70 factor (ECF subfamily)
VSIDATLAGRLHHQANAGRWRVSPARFAAALEASARHAPDGGADATTLERYLSALHLDDLALACACADGDEAAWEHFVREQRPVLYRAANAIDPGGAARDLADSLYADLFGLRERDGDRQSLFRYFHGRSSLATWLRAVLAQRHVDRMRSQRRTEPLPDDESVAALPAPAVQFEPDRQRYLDLIRRVLLQVVALLAPRDRLRLACYYAREMTLAQTGKVLAEHEATTSRQLGRTRKAIREEVERLLKGAHHLSDAEVARCFECVIDEAGPLDLQHLLSTDGERKNSPLDRSR